MKELLLKYQNKILFYIAFLLSFIFTIYVIFFTGGINWPDEIFQSIEPAHEIITKKGLLPWEWQEKVRSSLYPLFLAALLKIIYLFTDSGLVTYFAIKSILALFFLMMLFVLYKCFCKEIKQEKILFAFPIFLLLVLLFPFNYYFGFRTLTESFSTSICILAIFLLFFYYKNYNFLKIFLLSLLIGLSYGIRFQVIFFYISFFPLFFFKLYKEKLLKQKLLPILLGGILGILIYGWSDFIYYGTFFISTYKYIEFNVMKNISVKWGTSPFYTYFVVFWTFFGIFSLCLFIQNFKKYYPLLISFWFYLLIHSFIPHKEIRFIYFLFPIAGFFISLSIGQIYEKIPSKLVTLKKAFIPLAIFFSLTQNIKSFQKKIPWNFQNKILQIFLKTHSINFKKNSLIHFTDNSDLTAGYVYLGPRFEGKLFFNRFSNHSVTEINDYLIKNKISQILTYKVQKEDFCNENNYCQVLLEVEDLVWITK